MNIKAGLCRLRWKFFSIFLLSYRIVHTLIYSLEKNQVKIRTKNGPKPGCSKNAHFACYLRMALLDIWGNGHLILYFLLLVYSLIWHLIKNQIKNRFRNSQEWRSFWEYQNDMSYTRGHPEKSDFDSLQYIFRPNHLTESFDQGIKMKVIK